ncbi:MAG TPA: MBL fold metallo-hydrolase [Candidatus Paceibacterota bacterium]|nr:MBL fold metallo-hydrolase [Candidatus Paceibacterota bacterium]
MADGNAGGNTATLTCYGGTGSVTGANFMLDAGSIRILIDCGMEQGVHHGDDPNAAPFRYDPASADVLFITHGHIDHIGRVPKLVHDGYRGPIYSTPATKEIAALMFDDALHVMREEEQKYHRPMLYQRADADAALAQWQTLEYHEPLALEHGITATLYDAGHVLGSAMVCLERDGRRAVFTGDLGNTDAPLLRATDPLPAPHYLLMESVYGDRLHEGKDDRRQVLKAAIEEARQKHGVLMIPAFSLQRTQVILYEIHRMIEAGELAPIDTYLDSPLAIRLMEVYSRYGRYFNDAAQADAKKGDIFSFPGLSVVERREESAKIEHQPDPKIIIAASGMSHGGRILGHERELLGRADAILLLVGYQAAGTLGRALEEGVKHVHIEGHKVHVRASIESLTGYSGHGDRDELMHVVETGASTLERVFVAMGEPKSAMFLAQRIHDFLGLDAVAPSEGDSFTLAW